MEDEEEEQCVAEADDDILPDEVWLSIFQYLTDTDLLACSLVCGRWHLLTQDASDRLEPMGLRIDSHWFPSCLFALSIWRILCDRKFYGKVKKSTLMATDNSYKALYYKKSLIENRNWMQDATLYASLLDETGEETPKARRKRAKKRRPTVALANDQLNVSSVRFNDRFLVAGTSLPDKGIEDIGNLMIEKTIGLWRRDSLDSAVASRALLDDEQRESKRDRDKLVPLQPDTVLRGHANSITRVLLGTTDTTSSTLLSASSDNTIRVWDLEELSCTSVLSGHAQSVYCLAWRQEEGVVFSGSKDKTVKVWNLASSTGAPVADISGSPKKDAHKRAIVCMDLLPHLNCLATGSLDKAVKLWDIETGACLKTEKKAHRGWVSCLRGGPHYLMCTGGDTKIKVWDTRTVESVVTIRKMKKAHSIGDYVSTIQFDQNKVVSGNMRGIVAMHDMCTARRINKFKAHSRRVADLQYDDSQLITASSDKKLKIWLFGEPREDLGKTGPGKCLLA